MSKHRKKLRIGITLGDPNGIGPELAIRALEIQGVRDAFTPIIYGSGKALHIYRKELHIDKFSYNQIEDPTEGKAQKVSLIECSPDLENITIGSPSQEAGKAALSALTRAVSDLKKGNLDALVTLPIDKQSIHSEDFPYSGHTEYLSKEFEAEENLMFLISEDLKVAVATGHVPLREVSSKITSELLMRKIKLINTTMKTDFNLPKPKIAVLGLNPHAGDRGLIGEEDLKIIRPTVEQASIERVYAFGPYSADGFFGSGQFREFDAVLAMYHDQGLIPFKYMAGWSGVNFTAGLPIVRTSPDHGVAYDLAGKGTANMQSFINAIYAAIDISKRRFDNELIQEGAMTR